LHQPPLGPENSAVDHEPGLGQVVRQLAAKGDAVEVAAHGGEYLLLRVTGRLPRCLDSELRADGLEMTALAVDDDRDHQVRDHRAPASTIRPTTTGPWCDRARPEPDTPWARSAFATIGRVPPGGCVPVMVAAISAPAGRAATGTKANRCMETTL